VAAAGNHAGVVGDDYIRITVFLAAAVQQLPQRLREQGPSRYLADGKFLHASTPGWNGAIVAYGSAAKPSAMRQAEDPKPSDLRPSLPINPPTPKGRPEGLWCRTGLPREPE
jgi:hypothetical protein